MRTAVIIDCVRTPVGRAHKDRGYYREVRSDDLATFCVQALLQRHAIPLAEIDDVIFGNTQQTREQGFNVARNVGLMSGLAVTTAGATINRLCGSSLQAINQAAHSIIANAEDVQIVGGLEHMHHLALDYGLDINPKLFQQTSKGAMHMGITAEFLAQTQGISRQEQDEFALASHQKAAAATAAGEFENEIVPVFGKNEQGERVLLKEDQCIRRDTTLAALSQLEPAFLPKLGTVTAGNSSPLNDGAAALLMMSDEKAKQFGLKPKVLVVATAVAGVEPCLMGTGPVPATAKALRRAGLDLADIGLIELNEAFAAQSLACIRLAKFNPEIVNVRGGAIAIGHPLGASGARITTTLINAMIDRDVEFGLSTMCIGLGQGIATIFQRVD